MTIYQEKPQRSEHEETNRSQMRRQQDTTENQRSHTKKRSTEKRTINVMQPTLITKQEGIQTP